MNDAKIRATLLNMALQYKAEQRVYLAKALETDIMEYKDENYRRAAIFGIRLASIDRTLLVVNEKDVSDLKRKRAFQKHNRDMLKLKYRDRHPNLQHDGLDNEVISQFNPVGIVINDKPHKYAKGISFTDVKIK